MRGGAVAVRFRLHAPPEAAAVVQIFKGLWKLAAINEQLGAGADGGAQALDQRLIFTGRRQGFLAKLHLARAGDRHGAAVHALILLDAP